jgi:hypothetical protein
MSIVSNEHQNGSPFPEPEAQEPLPECLKYGEWLAVPGRGAQSGGLYWDVYRGANERFATLWGEMTAQNLRETLRALDRAHTLGGEHARREVRRALGVICEGR